MIFLGIHRLRKSDFLFCFKNVYSYVETQFETQIKMVRTDNAISYVFTMKKAYATNLVAPTHPNKMEWLKENIDTYLKCQEPFNSSQKFQ